MKSIGGYAENGDALFETADFHGNNDPSTTLHQIFLNEGDSVVGVRADTSVTIDERKGFWRNLQFLVASRED